jgi:membrane protease YdiL (CAAX protease family)
VSVTPPSPWWLLAKVVLWFLVAVVAAVILFWLGKLLLGFAVVRLGLEPLPKPLFSGRLAEPVLEILIYAMCLPIALREGRIAGRGSIVAGLALGPITERRLIWWIVPLAAANVAVVIGLYHASSWMEGNVKPITVFGFDDPFGLMLSLLAIGVLAPLAEELWFRGWLWTGLRRSWGVPTTAVATGLFFMLAHTGSGWAKPLLTLPSVVLLSALRHFGGSTRASIAAHMVNNTLAVLIGLLMS